MEQIGENVSSLDSIILLPENPTKSGNSVQLQYPVKWDEESTAKFICRLCMKTFYNANALQNHKNIQHDEEVLGSDGDHSQPAPTNVEKRHFIDPQNTIGLCGFKFVPLKNRLMDPMIVKDGLTTRTYSQDTTYLIVTVEGDEIDSDAMKRSRLDGVVKKAQMKHKEPIDLRGPFTCTFPSTLRPDLQCRQIFFNCCDYSLHYREDHTKRRKAALRCQVCERRLDRDFYSSDTIADLQPSNNFTYSCNTCAETFLDSTEFDEHNRIVHAKMKPHQCSICAKRFTQQGGLQQHMRMHTGIRPFVCTFCPKAFTQKAGLEQHLRTHTKVKPFKCVICSKCFSQSVHLRQHMRTHTNIQPFECSLCSKRFKQSSHLNFHMRSHVGDGSLSVENFTQDGQHNHIEFLNLANLQQVQDGETLYYAAELAAGLAGEQHPFTFPPQIVIPENVLSL